MATKTDELFVVRNPQGDMLAGYGKDFIPKLYTEGYARAAANLKNRYLPPERQYQLVPVTLVFGEIITG